MLYCNSKGKYQSNIDKMGEMIPAVGKSELASVEVLRLLKRAASDWKEHGGGNIEFWYCPKELKQIVQTCRISHDEKRYVINALTKLRETFTAAKAKRKKHVDINKSCHAMILYKRKHTNEEINAFVDAAFDAVGGLLFKDLETKTPEAA